MFSRPFFSYFLQILLLDSFTSTQEKYCAFCFRHAKSCCQDTLTLITQNCSMNIFSEGPSIFTKSIVNFNSAVAWIHFVFTEFQNPKSPSLPTALGNAEFCKTDILPKGRQVAGNCIVLFYWVRGRVALLFHSQCFLCSAKTGRARSSQGCLAKSCPGLQSFQLVCFLSYAQVVVLINKALESDESIE